MFWYVTGNKPLGLLTGPAVVPSAGLPGHCEGKSVEGVGAQLLGCSPRVENGPPGVGGLAGLSG